MFSTSCVNHGTSWQSLRRICQRYVHIHGERIQSTKSKSPHIPLYKEPDKYLLNQTDLNLIITKTRFVAFCDEIQSMEATPYVSDMDEYRENGSFVLELSTEVAHAMYLVDPIWRRYCKQFPPASRDIECMLNYLNINESWTKGNYFIQRHILDHKTRETILTPKCWRSICEIGLKAVKHNECLHLIDCTVNHYKSIPKVIAWREVVKVLLIKRAFHKIVEYSPFIAQHIVDNKDRGLLDMVIHSIKILRSKSAGKKRKELISETDIQNMIICIEELYSHDLQRRNHLLSIVLGRKINEHDANSLSDTLSKPNWYVVNGSTAPSKSDDLESNDVSVDFVDENEEKECDLIAFKLNCLEIANRKMDQRLIANSDSNSNSISIEGNMVDLQTVNTVNVPIQPMYVSSSSESSYLSIFEWMFYASPPHHFLYLFQTTFDQLLHPQLKGAETICAYCLLSIFKCEARCGRNIREFLSAIRSNSLLKSMNDQYSQFMAYLADKYGGHRSNRENKKLEHRRLKSEIMDFMMKHDIMFWSFGHLQRWLKELLMVNNRDQRNKGFVEFLFNLMVRGMLYHDSFRIRPELRGFLRFGSYHQLAFIPQVMFWDEEVMQYLKGGLTNYRHPLSPFRFYTDQIRRYEQDVLDAQFKEKEVDLQDEEQSVQVDEGLDEESERDDDDGFEIADIARQHDFLESLRVLRV